MSTSSLASILELQCLFIFLIHIPDAIGRLHKLFYTNPSELTSAYKFSDVAYHISSLVDAAEGRAAAYGRNKQLYSALVGN